MTRLKSTNFILLIVLGVFTTLSTSLTLRSEETAGSRLQWLLSPGHHIERNRYEKTLLEECVSQIGFVDTVRIVPGSGRSTIEISIKNVSSIVITGLLVQPIDEKLNSLGMDGRVLIRFDALDPNAQTLYTEDVDGVIEHFPEVINVSLVAWDLVDSEGKQIVRDIFWTKWPTISSEDELEAAKADLCRNE